MLLDKKHISAKHFEEHSCSLDLFSHCWASLPRIHDPRSSSRFDLSFLIYDAIAGRWCDVESRPSISRCRFLRLKDVSWSSSRWNSSSSILRNIFPYILWIFSYRWKVPEISFPPTIFFNLKIIAYLWSTEGRKKNRFINRRDLWKTIVESQKDEERTDYPAIWKCAFNSLAYGMGDKCGAYRGAGKRGRLVPTLFSRKRIF